jgi:indole-3-glycerol phosphate synthase
MSILTKILDRKQIEVAALDARALRRAAEQSPRPADFISALNSHRVADRPGLIAELKRASPSKGLLAPHLDMLDAACVYAANGAAAISALTDETFFQGSLDTLCRLRFTENIGLPLLRKDFIIAEAQLYETRAGGADAVLLIAAAIPDDARLTALHALALELGLTPLVEVHNRTETERVLKLKDLRLVGINNRDLDSFNVTLETTERLRPMIPAGINVVAESGIFNAADVERLARAGVDAVLVGEALVTAPDMPARVRELSGFSEPNGTPEMEVLLP